ncbi:restriction endonuclease subunit S [Bacillus cereus]|uniref:restriction endonuclease subunit S n=1 Tax=Bacillus TaxID=1386 RepID=UPI003B682BC5
MNLLLNQFDIIFDSSESVQELEALILDMAIRGKLVSQDTSDEPASILLEKIKKEKEQLIQEKKIKKEKILPQIKEEEKPFDLPDGWEWVRLQSLIKKIGAGSTPRGGKAVYVDKGVKFIRSQNVWNDGLYLNGVAYITEEINNKMSGSIVKPNDLLLNITGGSIGRCCIVPSNFDVGNVNQHVSIIRLVDNNDTLRQYLHCCLISSYIQKTIMSTQVGISREGLSISKLSGFLIPIPPLNEQKRIVEKLNQLMCFCDKLKERLEKKQRREDKLNLSVFSTLEQSQTVEELKENLQFILSHLHSLCKNTKHVQQLRNAILSLAVKGKLVTQDETEEPASVSMERIKKEKEQLIQEKKIKKEKPLLQITDEEKSFEVPNGWGWDRLGGLALKVVDGTHHSPQSFANGDYLYITAKNIKNKGVDTSNVTYVLKDVHEEIYSRCNVEKGDILLIKDGATTGIVTINQLKQDFSLLSSVGLIKTSNDFIDNQYLVYCIRSPFLQGQIKGMMKGSAITRITIQKIKNFVIPIPPLGEQKRIVEKVNQLMSLCDELESNIEQSRLESETLMKAVLQEAFTVKEEVIN